MPYSIPNNPGNLQNGPSYPNSAVDVLANDQALLSAINTHEPLVNGAHGISSGAIVGTEATQTLSNKTIASPVLSGTITGTYTIGGTPTLSGTVAGSPIFSGNPTLSAPLIGMQDKGNSGAGTVTCDCAVASKFLITATGNFTLAFSNFTNGQRIEVWILQDATGSRTVTWPTAVRWMNGSGATDSTTDKPTLTTTANKFDVISFERFDAVGTDANIYAFVRGFKGAIT